jgi:hypothetical protein
MNCRLLCELRLALFDRHLRHVGFGALRFDFRVQAGAHTLAGQVEQPLALLRGPVGQCFELLRPRQFNIRLRDRARQQQAGAGGIEPGGLGYISRLLDQRRLAAPEVEVPAEVRAEASFPERAAAVGRRENVVGAHALARGVGVERDLRVVRRPDRERQLLRAADAGEGSGQSRIAG